VSIVKPPEIKSVWLVTSGRVRVKRYYIHNDGDVSIVEAMGTVHGSRLYDVTLDRDGNTCTCDYGRNHSHLPKDSHSHDTALRIEVERQDRREQND